MFTPYLKRVAVVAGLAMAALSAQATVSPANTFDTIYGANFTNLSSSYSTTFLGGTVASFAAKIDGSAARFSFKPGQDGFLGVGVSPSHGNGRTPGEIDIGETITGSFSRGVLVKNFSVGLLFNGPEYDDVKENAIVSVLYADNTTANFSLIATGNTVALWNGSKTQVTNLSPASISKGGAWSVADPFGNKLVSQVTFGAATGVRGEGKGTNQSDYTLLSITAAVPEPETYAMLLAGLLAIGAAARRKKSS
ncbi:MAG: PEP-CTERM sorting domain-containing protein [Rhodoferax sp.]|uniref:PEP-CTERM sorting domain-containing protein n=1 Tax=Rhodoferax sp. TaxID=50421 RepID=UPI002ACDA839|nr:PEP-CTERM sorting domain-containing protein [Rhodoferax sp.]MDZ7892862.1 PEP-CTERM sorting domain-containing protein [Rhodoferax sp.]